MSISFHDVLKSYFFEIENKLEAEKQLSAIFPNNSDKGIIRESVYAKFLIDHLPANAEVLFGGFLFNKEGDVSPQYDILIVHSSAPKFNVNGKCFASVDACIAIISIKTNLTTNALSDELISFQKMPIKTNLNALKLSPWITIKEDGFNNVPHKIIFAYDGISRENFLSSYNKAVELAGVGEDLNAFYNLPTLIHVNKKLFFQKIYTDEIAEQLKEDSNIKKYGQVLFENISPCVGFPQCIDTITKATNTFNFIFPNYNEIFTKVDFSESMNTCRII